MRSTVFAAAVGSAVALVGFAGAANASATIDLIASEDRPLSEIAAPLKRYSASGEINRRVSDVETILEEIRSEHADAPVVSQLDGLLVRYPDWWFNVRPSNTEPVLRLNVEADNEPLMIEKRDALLARIGGC